MLDRSPLYGSFQATRGFAAVFRRDGVDALKQRLPELSFFVEALLSLREAFALVPWWRRPFTSAPTPNAFYLNVLAVPRGAKVDRHVDATLRGPSGDNEALPLRVSVLYLRVPHDMRGGRLRLHAGGLHVADVRPSERTLLHFRGDLAHEVLPFEARSEQALRLSVVCEQYVLSDTALGRLPPFQLQSKASFDNHLKDHRNRR